MKKNCFQKICKKLFAFFLLFCSLQCFAQSSNSTDSRITSFQYIKKLNSVFDFVQQNYIDEIDPKVLYEGALKGMMDALEDPYSIYLSNEIMRDLTDTIYGSFGGVGLTISKLIESTAEKPAFIEVVSPIEGTPGAKAGIQSGDLITAIDGKSTAEISMNEVLEVLRGEVGTEVTLSILRGKSIKFDVKIIRAMIEVPTVKFGMIENSQIGYIRIIDFTPITAVRVQDALNEIEKHDYKSLIIDLRDNPGGLINSAIEVADKFIEKGPIVSTKSRLLFENQQFSANEEKTTVKPNIPIIVLINKGAASASEILSGALKDYHIAYLVGERTYGKGSVQQVVPLSNSDGIKLTMARYYTPSDTNIDKVGIPPDLEISNFQKFTEEQEKQYLEMLNKNVINQIVEENPNMNEEQISKEASNIAKTYDFEERILRRLLRIQLQKNHIAPLYDLDYDLQLQAAINVINDNNFSELVKNTKTLKQLQEELNKEKENEKVATK